MEDGITVLLWWFAFLFIGTINLPFSIFIFSKLKDYGYLFSKVLGIVFISYTVFILAIFHLLPLSGWTILLSIIVLFCLNIYFYRKSKFYAVVSQNYGLFIFEEILFLITLLFWSFIRSHEPSIHGLEKFMDFGFINSINRSTYLPPVDMWFPPHPINYYYFGHFITALLTRISTIPSYISYNLMLATLFAFSFSLAFSIVYNLLHLIKLSAIKSIAGGLLGGFLLTLGGNLHTLYTLFSPYKNEHPIPLWKLQFQPHLFPNNYWYPNATRYIPYTIHEFPIYSFVVSDLHGHVLDIPFVLLCLLIIFIIWISEKLSIFIFVLQGMLLAVMYMTNAWDGILYFGLTMLVVFAKFMSIYPHIQHKAYKISFLSKKHISKKIIQRLLKILYSIYPYALRMLILAIAFVVFLKPFNTHFKPFVSGIGLLCAPPTISKGFTVGPLHIPGLTDIKTASMQIIDEGHCEPSPLWQLVILYGFFYFFIISFFIFMFFNRKSITKIDVFLMLLIVFSTLLIIAPELFYAKDIYPRHFRANTMFKLTYQAFMLLSLTSAFIIFRLIDFYSKNKAFYRLIPFILVSCVLVTAVLSYPYFAISSYYANLSVNKGLDGLAYLKDLYPDDYKAVMWINEHIKNQPVILEAQGDSYTDYGRISTNTGLPTILGWTVHEWLWRGSYDIPSPRIAEVTTLYESEDITQTKMLIDKYNIDYIYVGQLEREKYPALKENKIKTLGKIVFESGNTRIYKVTTR